ncbi:MAG: PH domain-containing protein [Candidatus Paceibacterota bacterium]
MIDLEQNEQVLLTSRRHWFTLFVRLFPLLLFAIVPIVIIAALQVLGSIAENSLTAGGKNFFPLSGSMPALIIFLLFSWLLCVWIGAFIIWTDYYLDVLIVTDHRIINVEQKALFSREIASLHLDKIQDVTIDINGVLATFLIFGDLRIQTAGEVEEFVIRNVKDPTTIKNVILEQHEKAMKKLRVVRIEKNDDV